MRSLLYPTFSFAPMSFEVGPLVERFADGATYQQRDDTASRIVVLFRRYSGMRIREHVEGSDIRRRVVGEIRKLKKAVERCQNTPLCDRTRNLVVTHLSARNISLQTLDETGNALQDLLEELGTPGAIIDDAGHALVHSLIEPYERLTNLRARGVSKATTVALQACPDTISFPQFVLASEQIILRAARAASGLQTYPPTQIENVRFEIDGIPKAIRWALKHRNSDLKLGPLPPHF